MAVMKLAKDLESNARELERAAAELENEERNCSYGIRDYSGEKVKAFVGDVSESVGETAQNLRIVSKNLMAYAAELIKAKQAQDKLDSINIK